MDPRAALEDMLITMGRSPQEIQRLMPPPNQGQPADVATEFAAALKGMPLAVGPEQDHEAHIRSHLPLLQTEGLPPNVMSALLAHVSEHVAAWYKLQALQAMQARGIPLPPPGMPVPPQMQAQLDQGMALAVAGMSDSIVTKLGGMLGAAGGDPNKMAELAFKREELQFRLEDSHRKSQETARQDQTELLKMRQASLDAEADRQLKRAELEQNLKTELMGHIADAGKQHADMQAAVQGRNREQFHDFHMKDADRKAAERAAQMEREHAAGESHTDRLTTAQAAAEDRQHQLGIATMGHVAGALDREATQAHASVEADASRRHDFGMAAADRQHQVGIASMGHDAALKKQKLAGETTLKAAAMKPKPKPAGAKKTAA
jgi:hypothetical protein